MQSRISKIGVGIKRKILVTGTDVEDYQRSHPLNKMLRNDCQPHATSLWPQTYRFHGWMVMGFRTCCPKCATLAYQRNLRNSRCWMDPVAISPAQGAARPTAFSWRKARPRLQEQREWTGRAILTPDPAPPPPFTTYTLHPLSGHIFHNVPLFFIKPSTKVFKFNLCHAKLTLHKLYVFLLVCLLLQRPSQDPRRVE